MSSIQNSLKKERSSRNIFLDDTRTLQDMPLEILDMILMKSALFPIRRSKKYYQPCPAVDLIQEALELLMTVWSEWYRRLTTRWFKIKFCQIGSKSNSVLWKMNSLDQKERVIVGFTKLHNRIYVLSSEPSSIYVYKDSGDFRLIKTISLGETIPIVCGIHSNQRADCLFVLEAPNQRDRFPKTIWKLDSDGNPITKWLEDQENEMLLSVTADGSVMIIKQPIYSRRNNNNIHGVRIEIYGPDATLKNTFGLSCRVFENCVQSWNSERCSYKMIANGISTQQGTFIISYQYVQNRCCVSTDYATALIHVNKNGEVMNALSSALFRPVGVDEVDVPMPTKAMTGYFFQYPSFVTFDEKSNRLFAADYKQDIIFVFDSDSLKWIESIRLHDKSSKETSIHHGGHWAIPTYYISEKKRAFPIYFDGEKRQLLVRNYETNHVEVYRMF